MLKHVRKTGQSAIQMQLLMRDKLFTTSFLHLDLVPLGRLQDAALTAALLGFAKGAAAGAHV